MELGVDIGGIDLTLHCGYPGSYENLIQQSGRAGRPGKKVKATATAAPIAAETVATAAGGGSLSLTVCFNSSPEQHLYRNPQTLLSRSSKNDENSDLEVALLEQHLLAASCESPVLPAKLSIKLAASRNYDANERSDWDGIYDEVLFGGVEAFEKSLLSLKSKKKIVPRQLTFVNNSVSSTLVVFANVPAYKSAHRLINIRDIEPVQ